MKITAQQSSCLSNWQVFVTFNVSNLWFPNQKCTHRIILYSRKQYGQHVYMGFFMVVTSDDKILTSIQQYLYQNGGITYYTKYQLLGLLILGNAVLDCHGTVLFKQYYGHQYRMVVIATVRNKVK